MSTSNTLGTSTAPSSRTLPARPTRRDLVDPVTWGLAIANLIAQIGIIVTGGAVRLTGSGLGCSTWPMCEPGSFTPVFHEEMGIHPLIEFGNRTLTGVLTAIAVALVLAVHRREPTRSRPAALKALTWWPLIGIAVQAVVGGISVRITLHPLLVGFHMLLSLALVAFSTYLLVRLASPDGPALPVAAGSARAVPYVLAVLAAVLCALGTLVTGTGPLSGDASDIIRLGFDHEVITRLHAATVWLFLLLTLGTLVAVVGARRSARGSGDVTAPALDRLLRALVALVVACVLTGAIGYTQYLTGLPALMVGLHMTGSALVVAATAWVCSSFWQRVSAA